MLNKSRLNKEILKRTDDKVLLQYCEDIVYCMDDDELSDNALDIDYECLADDTVEEARNKRKNNYDDFVYGFKFFDIHTEFDKNGWARTTVVAYVGKDKFEVYFPNVVELDNNKLWAVATAINCAGWLGKTITNEMLEEFVNNAESISEEMNDIENLETQVLNIYKRIDRYTVK